MDHISSSSYIQERGVMPLFFLRNSFRMFTLVYVSGEKSPTQLPPSATQPSLEPSQPRNSYVVVFIVGALTGGVLNTILFYYLKHRNKQ